MNKKIAYLDFFKFIFSVCIVAIHSELLWNSSFNVNWYVKHLVFRLSVPFFFVVSGFLLGLKIINNPNAISIIKKYIRKLMVPYLFWLAIGFPLEFYSKYNGGVFSTLKVLAKEFLFYPWGALWYILALIVSVILLSFFCRSQKYNLVLKIGSILYIFALLSNSYFFIAEKNSHLKNVIEFYTKHFISSRNGIFVGLLLVSIGIIIAQKYKENSIPNINKCKVSLIICFIIYTIELTVVKNRHYIDDSSLFVILPLLIYYLVCFIINIKSNEDYSLFRKYSVCIYFCHRPILAVMMLVFKFHYGVLCFLFDLFLSLWLSKFLLNSNNKFIKKITLS